MAPVWQRRASQVQPHGDKLQASTAPCLSYSSTVLSLHDGVSTTASVCSSPRSVHDGDLAARLEVRFPVQLRVKRTFLEFPLQGSPSQLRRTQSAPSLLSKGAACPPPTCPPQRLHWADIEEDLDIPSPSSALPSKGSAEHYSGDCKPCAFFWKDRGCSLGADCPFCHMCDSAEKKRRQKEKKFALQKRETAKSRPSLTGDCVGQQVGRIGKRVR